MLWLDKPLARRSFLAWGVGLLALKILLDAAISAAYGRSFSLALYVDPFGPLLPEATAGSANSTVLPPASAYWLTVAGTSLPFLLAGVALMIRRLRDAGLPPTLALLFFAPFLKFLAFAALAVIPSKHPPRMARYDDGPFRSAEIDVTPPVPSERSVARSRHRIALLYGAFSGAAVGVLAMVFSVVVLREYGAPLLIATPFVGGFTATSVYARLHRPSARGTLAVTGLALTVALVAMVLSAMEGMACILLASPLLCAEALLGGYLAHSIACSNPSAELPFRAGIAAPLAATIDGEGPGAVRRCEFTTGTFVEPIVVWVPGRELSFSVSSQPDPMREVTLYAGPRPPHLDGYLESTRGQFVLEPLPDGSTRLVGRTWYRVHMAPVSYWRFWSDRIIHAIHMRVLRHVAALAEADARAPTPDR